MVWLCRLVALTLIVTSCATPYWQNIDSARRVSKEGIEDIIEISPPQETLSENVNGTGVRFHQGLWQGCLADLACSGEKLIRYGRMCFKNHLLLLFFSVYEYYTNVLEMAHFEVI